MRISVLASGSKGNSTFIEINNKRILIDVGLSCKYIEQKLKEIGVCPKTINIIFITHPHSDHIKGLKTFYNRYKSIICITPNMLKKLKQLIGDFNFSFYEQLNDINIETIPTSHDCIDSVGLLIENRIVYITDTGYIKDSYYKILSNKEVYIFESNHDIEMLIDSKYHYNLKQRILGVKGHLSNSEASNYLSKLVGSNTKYIFLVHLSEENNTKEKALMTLLTCIESSNLKKIIVASQKDRTELINVN